MYSDVRNELYLLFLQPILEEAQKVNKVFQTNGNDPVKLLKSLTLLIQGLAKRIVVSGLKENLLTVNVNNHLHPKPYLGYTFEEKMRQARSSKLLNVDDEMAIRLRCISFVATLVSNLQLRLPDNIEVLQSVSLLAPESCLRTVKPSVIPLAQLMQEPPEIITNIDFQWLKISFVEWKNTEMTVPFWVEVLQYKDAAGENPFVDLVNFAIKCLVLPWSNGEIERALSQMKIVKSPHRNRLDDSTLVAILIIRAGFRSLNLCCSTYQFPTSVLDQIGTLAAYTPRTSASDEVILDDVQRSEPLQQDLFTQDEDDPILDSF
ncbi:PREDICTED: uncharacterized protein LOC105565955 [Vollenhovia emeryi]|uniref:uncharacterized protein LOC105565955 n=1 Tax=Vollenhovia emeryi TaxID=411798 RepID=UPI0005F46811|nr:PREDICTED: uncharacterized protein LOC105565955 [Vollenhovia emeryi]